jgi:hypothetical protein
LLLDMVALDRGEEAGKFNRVEIDQEAIARD